jgi:membrane protein DedA with SNARE-associated domain
MDFGDSYLGIFLLLLAAGFGLPIPEELPVLTAGVLVGHEDTPLRWWIMLPVCIAGVVIGDGVLYGAGRLFGKRIVNNSWFQRKILSKEKRLHIEKNFHERGIWVLLGARLLPGIRSPVFLMAGVLRVPFGRFLLADGLYAIPGVNLLFWLAYFLTDQVLVVFNKVNEYRPLVAVGVLSAVVGILIYKFVVARPVAVGDPVHVPELVKKPAEAVAHMVDHVVESVTHRHHADKPAEEKPKEPEAKPEATTREAG